MPKACILEGLRSVLSMEDPLHVKLLEERGERNQFKILESQKEGFFLFFADLVALGFHSTKVQEHTCVLISSPNRTTHLREEHSQVHESNDGSIVFLLNSAHTL